MAEENYKHLLLRIQADTGKYTNPQGGGSGFSIFPGLNRKSHGGKLKKELEGAIEESSEIEKLRIENEINEKLGIYLTFESHKDYPLNVEKLEKEKDGIEIVRIYIEEEKEKAILFVPEGKIQVFFDKIEKYLTITTKKGNYRYRDLIESIEKIKLSALENFWSDSESFPQDIEKKYFLEAWLRVGDNRDLIINRFKEQARNAEIFVSEKPLKFPETTVFLIRSSMNQLKQSILILDCISEIKICKDTPASFLEMKPLEEMEWVNELKSRISYSSDHKEISVCILDTGVNYSHPLLGQSISEKEADSYNPNWGNTDHAGHGTEMAGLALYGDLYGLLLSNEQVVLNHSLESVKILPPNGSNPEDLLGVITKECVARAELLGIDKKRFFNMAVTSDQLKIKEGEPSSWSGSIDQIAFGNEEEKEPKRLFFISAGNLKYEDIKDYPTSNELNTIQNPAQAWNCLTVGAFTEKVDIEKMKYPELDAIAGKGELSPTSTTSFLWNESYWPIKPEIVMEGGNYAKDKKGFVTNNESLSLVTTNKDFQSKLLTYSLDTSAATAQASRYAALIASEYPEFWSETIRGLMIHSADYKKLNLDYPQIKNLNQQGKINILRKFGYGHPDLSIALSSGKSFCTLIIQDELQPYIKDGDIKTNEIKFYNLPLPVNALNQIPLEDVELKVTLSYFIEPNLKKINTRYAKTYSSCALRFDSKAATEEMEAFKKRVNKKEREKLDDGKYESGFSNPENSEWVFGSGIRNYGSIHSDIWLGTAAQLAKKESICIYPVGGWWRTRKKLEKYNNKIRFALLITIKTNSNEVDIYTEIANIIKIKV
jgi:hypothetical protein